MTMMIIWLSLMITFVIIELSVPALVSIWFGIGALASFTFSCFFGNNLIWLQILIFFVVSVATLLLLRKFIQKRSKNHLTNIDSYKDEVASCVKSIKKYEPGLVKFNGLTWTAEVESEEEVINENDLVKIKEVKGNKLIVKLYKEEN